MAKLESWGSMRRKITFKGNPLTLSGRVLKIGSLAPNFRVVMQDLQEVTLLNFKDKIKLISVFPSLDTPVCDLQVKEFNKKAAQVSSDVVILGISKDLPFAQKRFCSANNISSEVVLSDYRYSYFGINYGVIIRELSLLGRSVFIVDKSNTVRYIQIVEELTNPPDYAEVLKNLEEVIKSPTFASNKEKSPSKCIPCEGKVPPLPKDKIKTLISEYHGWELVEDKKLVKEFKFSNFADAKWFLDIVSAIAEEQGHHPTMTIIYNKLKVTLTTHAAGGLTENDFIMAALISECYGLP